MLLISMLCNISAFESEDSGKAGVADVTNKTP